MNGILSSGRHFVSIKNNMQKIKYLVNRTIHELIIWIYLFFDCILPDLTIITPIRSIFLCLFTLSKIGKSTRIRKWQYLTNIWKLIIGANCFINRWNLFDNNSIITVWDNCIIWYENKFLTTSHYRKEDVSDVSKLKQTTFSRPITIGNNVWITSNCTILPWSTIWDNVIIGAWSVVRWIIESNSIYGWIPANRIKQTEGFIPKLY